MNFLNDSVHRNHPVRYYDLTHLIHIADFDLPKYKEVISEQELTFEDRVKVIEKLIRENDE